MSQVPLCLKWLLVRRAMEDSQSSRLKLPVSFVKAGVEPSSSSGPQVFQSAEGTYVLAAPPSVMVTSLSQRDMDSIATPLFQQIRKSGSHPAPMYVPQWRQKESIPIHRCEHVEASKGLMPEAQWDWVQSQDFSASHVDRAVRVPLHKTERVTYQDGCPIQTEELTVLHATRASLLHAILKGGVASSIPSHGIEGLWSSARLQEAAFTWGSSIVEESAGIILEERLPKFRLHRVSPSTPTDSERGSLADDKIRSSGAGGYFGWAVAGQSRREATRQRVFWVLCCSLENMSSTMDANPVPSGRQDKQARRMHDMRQCMATAYAQAAEILLRSDQSNSGFWESTGARLVKNEWHAGRPISRAPTNLCLLHVVQKGLSLCKDEDGVHGAFKDSEDLYLVSMSLSADITAILYPTQAYSGAGTKTIEYQKAGSTSFNQVSIPLMAFLYKHFRHSVWPRFLRGRPQDRHVYLRSTSGRLPGRGSTTKDKGHSFTTRLVPVPQTRHHWGRHLPR